MQLRCCKASQDIVAFLQDAAALLPTSAWRPAPVGLFVRRAAGFAWNDILARSLQYMKQVGAGYDNAAQGAAQWLCMLCDMPHMGDHASKGHAGLHFTP